MARGKAYCINVPSNVPMREIATYCVDMQVEHAKAAILKYDGVDMGLGTKLMLQSL